MQKLIQGFRINARNSGFLVDFSFMNKVNGDFQSGLRCALAVTGLQQEELCILNGELHILHICIMIFQKMSGLDEFIIDFGHFLLQMSDSGRCADTGYNVFPLCIDEVFAEDGVFTSGRIAGERNTGTGCVGHIAENHLLNVDRSSQIIRDFIHLAVEDGAFIVPALKYGGDGFFELCTGILREFFTGQFFIKHFVLLGNFLQLFRAQFIVLLNVGFFFFFFENVLKFGAIQTDGDIREHRDETTIGVIRPMRIAGLFGDRLYGNVVQTEVQNGIHHTRHGNRRTRTNRDKKRIGFISEFFAGRFFKMLHVLADFLFQRSPQFLFFLEFGAGFGRDDETLRNTNA